VGIADDGEILGIQPDLDLKNMDEDRYVNALTTAIERSLGPLASAMVRIQLQRVEGGILCLLHVPAAPDPIFANVSKGDRVSFVRVNNSTRVLEGPDLVGYVNQRWIHKLESSA
jgi:type I restriction enzyme R subunit